MQAQDQIDISKLLNNYLKLRFNLTVKDYVYIPEESTDTPAESSTELGYFPILDIFNDPLLVNDAFCKDLANEKLEETLGFTEDHTISTKLIRIYTFFRSAQLNDKSYQNPNMSSFIPIVIEKEKSIIIVKIPCNPEYEFDVPEKIYLVNKKEANSIDIRDRSKAINRFLEMYRNKYTYSDKNTPSTDKKILVIDIVCAVVLLLLVSIVFLKTFSLVGIVQRKSLLVVK